MQGVACRVKILSSLDQLDKVFHCLLFTFVSLKKFSRIERIPVVLGMTVCEGPMLLASYFHLHVRDSARDARFGLAVV